MIAGMVPEGTNLGTESLLDAAYEVAYNLGVNGSPKPCKGRTYRVMGQDVTLTRNGQVMQTMLSAWKQGVRDGRKV